MSKILPLRNVRGPLEITACEICGDPIEIGCGYSVISGDNVDGYVCVDCFSRGTPQDEQVFLAMNDLSIVN